MSEYIVGAILAGGRARRFGSEKALALLGGRTLLERVALHLSLAKEIVVNAPGDSETAALAEKLGFALAPDATGDPAGPLSGVKASLIWAQSKRARTLLVAPCDTPLLPADLYPRLIATLGEAPVAIAETVDGLHPLCGAWRAAVLPQLAAALAGGAHPPVRDALAAIGAARIRFEDAAAFANINTQDDLARAEKGLY